MNENPIYPAEFRSHRRLAYATAVAAVVIGGTIVLVPVSLRWQQQAEPRDPIELQLVPLVKDISTEEPVMDEPPEETPAEQMAEESPSESPSGVDGDPLLTDPVEQAAPTVDWYTVMQDVVQDDNLFATPTMHPGLDERRRVARIRFRKSNAPVKKEIWDNVEKDQMGRTILRAGDCYRVLDDPSVANQWLQENFTQYMIFCSNGKTIPKAFPFVAVVVERYAYLQQDDGLKKSGWQ
jgi:hypothetical protein